MKNLVFDFLNTNEAETFEGTGSKVVFDVWVPGNAAWPTGAELQLYWQTHKSHENPPFFRLLDGIVFTAPGSIRIYLTDGGIYKFESPVPGIKCYKWSVNEKIIDKTRGN